MSGTDGGSGEATAFVRLTGPQFSELCDILLDVAHPLYRHLHESARYWPESRWDALQARLQALRNEVGV